MIIHKKILYVSSIGSGTIEMFDISNPTEPYYVGSIEDERLDSPSGLTKKVT